MVKFKSLMSHHNRKPMLFLEYLGIIDKKMTKKVWPWRPAFIVTRDHMLWGLEQLNTNASNPTTWFPYIVGIRIMMSSQNASIYFSVSITHCNVISLYVGWPRSRLRMTKWPMFVSDDSFGYPSGYDWNDPVCLLSTYVGLCRWQPTYIFYISKIVVT